MGLNSKCKNNRDFQLRSRSVGVCGYTVTEGDINTISYTFLLEAGQGDQSPGMVGYEKCGLDNINCDQKLNMTGFFKEFGRIFY